MEHSRINSDWQIKEKFLTDYKYSLRRKTIFCILKANQNTNNFVNSIKYSRFKSVGLLSLCSLGGL
jgi:hypothetical protein